MAPMHVSTFARRLSAVAALTLAGCGGLDLRLIDGEATLDARLNPAPCVVGASELDFELRTPLGWERVALEDADPEAPMVEALGLALREQPWATIPGRARAGRRTSVSAVASKTHRLLTHPHAPASA